MQSRNSSCQSSNFIGESLGLYLEHMVEPSGRDVRTSKAFPLPPEIQLDTDFASGVSEKSATTPAARSVIKAQGLVPR